MEWSLRPVMKEEGEERKKERRSKVK